MEEFIQQVVSGISIGAIYAVIALAVVLIFRSTSIVNFAQGEIAMFTAFIAWSFMLRMNFWPGFLLTIVLAFVLGAMLEIIVMRPVEKASHLNSIVVTLGLLAIFSSLALWIYGPVPKVFPRPGILAGESLSVGTITISRLDFGTLVAAFVIMLVLFALFNYTKVGLAMRATAQNPTASRLVGINVSMMLALGWGLAAAVGAVAGMLTAMDPALSVDMMFGILIFGFAGAVLGGLDSPGGAALGGLTVGVIQALAGNYLSSQIDVMVAFLVIVTVLVIKPTGVFGRRAIQRV